MGASDPDRKVSMKHCLPPLTLQNCDDNYRTDMLTPNVWGNQDLDPEFYRASTPGTPGSPDKYSR